MATLLDVNDLRVEFGLSGGFGRRRRVLKAVDDVSFSVGVGETVAVVGESGSGKSTIGRAVLGLVQASAGQIAFDGVELTSLRPRERRGLVSDLQVVFQDPFSSLNPSLTVGESLAEPLRMHRGFGRGQAAEVVREALDSVSLPADSADRYPAEFSGGQRQRVAIARALAVKPRLIVCDEAVSALDQSTQAQVINLLSDLQRQTQVAYLFISHDLAVVRHLSQQVIVLYRGRIMESGPSGLVCETPSHPYTKALLAAAPVADPALQRRRRQERARLSATTTAQASATPDAACPFAARCPHAEAVCWSVRPAVSAVGESRIACHMYDPTSEHSAAAGHRTQQS